MATWWSTWQEQNPYATFAQRYGWSPTDQPFAIEDPAELYPKLTGWIGSKYTTEDAWRNWASQFSDFDAVYNAYADANPSLARWLTGGRQATDPGSIAYTERLILQSMWDAWTNYVPTPPPPEPEPEVEEIIAPQWWELEINPETGQPYTSLEQWIRVNMQPYIDDLTGLYQPENLPQMGDLGYGTLDKLMAQLANPGAWGEEAEVAEARAMGFFTPDGQPDVAALRQWKSTRDFSFREGMTPEQEAASRRAYGLTEQTSRENARLMAEQAFGNSGGMMAKMEAAYDEASRSITSDRAKFEIDQANQDFAMRLQEQQIYDQQFAQGQISYQDYLDTKESSIAQALQVWSTQAMTMLGQYTAEWAGVMNTAALIQDAAMMALGVNQQVVEILQGYFNLYKDVGTYDQYIEQLDLAIANMEQELAAGDFSGLMGFLALIVELIGALV